MLKLFFIVWIISGILYAGIKFAYNQREYPSLAKRHYWKDFRNAYLIGLVGGPFILYFTLTDHWILTRFKYNGVKFW